MHRRSKRTILQSRGLLLLLLQDGFDVSNVPDDLQDFKGHMCAINKTAVGTQAAFSRSAATTGTITAKQHGVGFSCIDRHPGQLIVVTTHAQMPRLFSPRFDTLLSRCDLAG
jgi:hypothetical protein